MGSGQIKRDLPLVERTFPQLLAQELADAAHTVCPYSRMASSAYDVREGIRMTAAWRWGGLPIERCRRVLTNARVAQVKIVGVGEFEKAMSDTEIGADFS